LAQLFVAERNIMDAVRDTCKASKLFFVSKWQFHHAEWDTRRGHSPLDHGAETLRPVRLEPGLGKTF
jgi:hypothetical protein